METFLCEDDYGVYLGLMKTWCDRHRVRIQAYCLMPNHVHLIAVPETLDGLSRAIGEAHRRYTRHINFREGRIGLNTDSGAGEKASTPLFGGFCGQCSNPLE